MEGAPLGLTWLASATGFAFAMSATPGPNNTMVVASAVNFGLRRTLPHILGIALGFPAMLLVVVLGAAEVLQGAPGLQWALRWVGTAWLLWLAWRIATTPPAAPDLGKPAGKPLGLLAAAAFQWVNPKAWMIAGSAIAAYTGGEAGLLREAAVLAAIFVVAALLSVLAWAALGAGIARLLPSAGTLRAFNYAMAALLVLSLLPVVAG
jgi:threonine/homoserine/homoserine lactone efflux protein